MRRGARRGDFLQKWPKSHFESGAFNRALPPLRFVYNGLRDAPWFSFMPVAVLMALCTAEMRSIAAFL